LRLASKSKHFGRDGHTGFLAIKYKLPSGNMSGRLPKAEVFTFRVTR
jgi:hypothetical protein